MPATQHRMENIHAEINHARVSVGNLSHLVKTGNLNLEQLREVLEQLATLIRETQSATVESQQNDQDGNREKV